MADILCRTAVEIAKRAIFLQLPGPAVERALAGRSFPGRVFAVAAGKAAWPMAQAAVQALGDRLTRGVVVTKYGHVQGPLPRVDCYEGGHPVPDEQGVAGTRAALALTQGLRAEDTVLVLLSGGASALLEQPLIPLAQLRCLTEQLLASGCNIREINTVRKRLSAVKGGRLAQHCAPARVETLVLSDVLGDPLDMIASGPTVPDSSTCAEAEAVLRRAGIHPGPEAEALLRRETPKQLPAARIEVIGHVRGLCADAAKTCRTLGWKPVLLTDRLSCEAAEAGRLLGSLAATHAGDTERTAWIAGGETVVHLGEHYGVGGRNQELALAAAGEIAGCRQALVLSVGSDGTDGPTDAAGGWVNGDTAELLRREGISPERALAEHNAYHALDAAGALIRTGPTGTNVNDLSLVLTGGS